MIRVYNHIDPTKLTDEEWVAAWREIEWATENGHPRYVQKGVLVDE